MHKDGEWLRLSNRDRRYDQSHRPESVVGVPRLEHRLPCGARLMPNSIDGSGNAVVDSGASIPQTPAMLQTISWTEEVLRLGAAVLVGAIVGVNRDLHGKPAGVRTHALVALGAALVVAATVELLPQGDGGVSRTFQGIITGVGFLGAGVILHPSGQASRVQGLTTAASIWVTACLGAVCGCGLWQTALLGGSFMLLVLVVGGAIERLAERVFGRTQPSQDTDGPGSAKAA